MICLCKTVMLFLSLFLSVTSSCLSCPVMGCSYLLLFFFTPEKLKQCRCHSECEFFVFFNSNQTHVDCSLKAALETCFEGCFHRWKGLVHPVYYPVSQPCHESYLCEADNVQLLLTLSQRGVDSPQW